jgi:uncharacterized membrane protein YagU involved in acid resistance
MQRLLIGLISGIVATGPMTAVMILWHRRLPRGERYPLPPREITMKLAREAGVSGAMDRETRAAATMLAHFGYGAATGGLFGVVSPRVDAPGVMKGIGFGLAVWVVSYLGLLPGLRVLSPATSHPARRNLLMIVAHGIWGAVLGAMAELLWHEASRELDGPLSSAGEKHADVNRRARR